MYFTVSIEIEDSTSANASFMAFESMLGVIPTLAPEAWLNFLMLDSFITTKETLLMTLLDKSVTDEIALSVR